MTRKLLLVLVGTGATGALAVGSVAGVVVHVKKNKVNNDTQIQNIRLNEAETVLSNEAEVAILDATQIFENYLIDAEINGFKINPANLIFTKNQNINDIIFKETSPLKFDSLLSFEAIVTESNLDNFTFEMIVKDQLGKVIKSTTIKSSGWNDKTQLLTSLIDSISGRTFEATTSDTTSEFISRFKSSNITRQIDELSVINSRIKNFIFSLPITNLSSISIDATQPENSNGEVKIDFAIQLNEKTFPFSFLLNSFKTTTVDETPSETPNDPTNEIGVILPLPNDNSEPSTTPTISTEDEMRMAKVASTLKDNFLNVNALDAMLTASVFEKTLLLPNLANINNKISSTGVTLLEKDVYQLKVININDWSGKIIFQLVLNNLEKTIINFGFNGFVSIKAKFEEVFNKFTIEIAKPINVSVNKTAFQFLRDDLAEEQISLFDLINLILPFVSRIEGSRLLKLLSETSSFSNDIKVVSKTAEEVANSETIKIVWGVAIDGQIYRATGTIGGFKTLEEQIKLIQSIELARLAETMRLAEVERRAEVERLAIAKKILDDAKNKDEKRLEQLASYIKSKNNIFKIPVDLNAIDYFEKIKDETNTKTVINYLFNETTGIIQDWKLKELLKGNASKIEDTVKYASVKILNDENNELPFTVYFRVSFGQAEGIYTIKLSGLNTIFDYANSTLFLAGVQHEYFFDTINYLAFNWDKTKPATYTARALMAFMEESNTHLAKLIQDLILAKRISWYSFTKYNGNEEDRQIIITLKTGEQLYFKLKFDVNIVPGKTSTETIHYYSSVYQVYDHIVEKSRIYNASVPVRFID